MPNYKNTPINKSDLLKRMVLEAVTIKRSQFSIKEDVHPFETLTDRTGECLRDLLHDPEHSYQDWGAELLEYRYFIKKLLILVGSPGIAERLPDNAAEKLGRLLDFFEIMHENSETVLPWLDMMHGEFVSANEDDEWIDRTITYYDFSKRFDHPHGSHYFHSYEAEHLKKQELAFPAIRKAMEGAANQ